jgi:hypothetical protein
MMISPRSLQGDIITESTDFSSLTPYNQFFAVFPYDRLGEIAHLTNIQLLQEKCAHIAGRHAIEVLRRIGAHNAIRQASRYVEA